MDRQYPKAAPGDTRGTLEAWLDYQREGVLTRATGLQDADAAMSPVASGTSVTGIVRHLALVEDYWFGAAMRGGAPLAGDERFEEGWATGPHSSLGDAITEYAAACARSRAIQVEIEAMDQPAAREALSDLDYAWVLAHMIEETARHLGHLDVLRELCDGETGQ